MALVWNMPDPAQLRRVAHQAAAEHILAEAQKTVPRESNELHNSGTAESDDLRGRVGYNTPYAVIQHEVLHTKHAGGGQAKWLEKATLGAAGRIAGVMADAIEKHLS